MIETTRGLVAKLSLPGSLSRGQSVVLLALIPLGVLAVFWIPIGGGFDEEQHLRRAWEMSALVWVPNSMLGPEMPVPSIFDDLSYREQPIVRSIEPGFWEEHGGKSLDAHGYTYDDAKTRSVYSPAVLLPQSMVVRYLGRKYELSALTVIYAARAAGLLSYVLLAYLAVRLIPYGKWLFAIVAATPTALFQASTVSADAVSNGIGLLFIAGTLAMTRQDRLGWRELAGVLGLVALLFLGKINQVPLALLPLLLLRPSRFQLRGGYWAMAGLIVVLFAVAVVGWNAVAYLPQGTGGGQPRIGAKLLDLAGRPFWYLGSLAKHFWQEGVTYFRTWIGAFGYYYWPTPSLTRLFHALAILVALFASADQTGPKPRSRIVLVFVGALAVLATALSLQLTAEPLGSEGIHVLHGRYFAAIFPLFFLAVHGLGPSAGKRIPGWLPGGGALLSLSLFTAGIYLAYHVPCGTALYAPGVCYRPQYKNWAPNWRLSPPLAEGAVLTQEFVGECDGMSQLRVWSVRDDSPSNGSTTFQINDESSGSVLLTRTIPNEQLPQDGWVELTFDRQQDSFQKRYALSIKGSGPEGSAPRVGYTIRHEYRAGRLHENGETVSTDLFFQVGCQPQLSGLLADFK